MSRLRKWMVSVVAIGTVASCTHDPLPSAPTRATSLNITAPSFDLSVSGATYGQSGQFLAPGECDGTIARVDTVDGPPALQDTAIDTTYQAIAPCAPTEPYNGGFADVIVTLNGSSTTYRQPATVLQSAQVVNIPGNASVALEADPASGYSFLDWRIYQAGSVTVSYDPVLNLSGTIADHYYLELIVASPPPPPPPPDTGSSTCFDPTQPSCNSTGN